LAILLNQSSKLRNSTIHSHTFDNGLALVAEPMQSMQSAAFTFLAPAGCCFDPAGEAGLASLTCEMMLRGCGARDSRQFVSDLERLGVERGESVGTSRATFSGATVHDSLFPALEIYADLLRRPRLPADQLEAGRQVCLQELRAIEDEPSHKLMIELRRRHYPDPWGRPSHGEREALETMPIDSIRAFHERYYVPSGAILGVAGRFDWPELVDVVGRLFGDWPSAQLAAPAETPPARNVTHLAAESAQTHVGIAYPSIPYSHPDYFQAWGAVGVLSSGMSSRLFTEVREKRGLCYTVSASLHSLKNQAAVLCHAGTSAERAQETLDVTLAELRRLAGGIRPEELDRLKARIKSGLIMQQESTSSRSGALAREWYHLGYARTLDEIGQLVDALSAESINAFLSDHPPQEFTVVTLGPNPLEVFL
jgi:predicted Zn-dependent peptidase